MIAIGHNYDSVTQANQATDNRAHSEHCREALKVQAIIKIALE